jgi:hypothetical protein
LQEESKEEVKPKKKIIKKKKTDVENSEQSNTLKESRTDDELAPKIKKANQSIKKAERRTTIDIPNNPVIEEVEKEIIEKNGKKIIKKKIIKKKNN